MFIGVSMDKCLACRWFQFLAQAIFIIYNFLQTETFANSIFSHGCSSLNLLKGFDDKDLWDEKKNILYIKICSLLIYGRSVGKGRF